MFLPDSHVVNLVREVSKTIVVVLAVVEVGRKVAVVDPDVLRLLDANGIALALRDLADSQVLDDNVLGVLNKEANANEVGLRVLADDGLVTADPDLVGVALDGALDPNDLGVVALDFGEELLVGGDGDLSAASTTSGAAVLGSETERLAGGGGRDSRSRVAGSGAVVLSGNDGSRDGGSGKGRQGAEKRELHVWSGKMRD